MQQIPLKAIPNQAFNSLLDNNSWDFVIRSTNGVMSVTLSLNSELVIDNMRAVAGSFVIPSLYQEAGNFIFITANNQLPDYRLFGITQSLIYASADELAVLRTPAAPPITEAYFNPIAALPLRFKPQGYVLA